ncbi:MAG: polysaccharide deacetylase family protein [Fimbriimonadaceae bacterium]
MFQGFKVAVCLSAAVFAGRALPSTIAGGHAPFRGRVTKRKADTRGKVLVVMYHNFGPSESRYVRSYKDFRQDLQNFYDLGFRPVTMSEYLSNTMPLPPGASPVVITMDDSAPTQFSVNRKGNIDPNCGVGIWRTFALSHPDFPVRGTFYVLPPVMWGQHAWRHQKVRLLKKWGSELACHTWSHPQLRYLSDAEVERELGRSLSFLSSLGFDTPSFAYPYGVYPRHRAILKGFKWKGHEYRLTGAVTCNPELGPPPAHAHKHPYEIGRIEARRGFLALDYWMPEFKRNEHRLYVMP